LQRNSNSEIFTKQADVKDNIHDAIHVISVHKHQMDRVFTTLHKLKEGLVYKAQSEKVKNPQINYLPIKYLKADIEEPLHSDGTFHMGHPYE
jgi:hypothetical protein